MSDRTKVYAGPTLRESLEVRARQEEAAAEHHTREAQRLRLLLNAATGPNRKDQPQ